MSDLHRASSRIASLQLWLHLSPAHRPWLFGIQSIHSSSLGEETSGGNLLGKILHQTFIEKTIGVSLGNLGIETR